MWHAERPFSMDTTSVMFIQRDNGFKLSGLHLMYSECIRSLVLELEKVANNKEAKQLKVNSMLIAQYCS